MNITEHTINKLARMSPDAAQAMLEFDATSSYMEKFEVKTTDDGKFWSPEYKGVAFDTIDELVLCVKIKYFTSKTDQVVW